MIANWTFPYLKIQITDMKAMWGNWLITEVRELVLLLDCAQYRCKLGFSNLGEDSHLYETCQGAILCLVKHMARIKQCVENFQNQFTFQKENGLKTIKVRFFFSLLHSKVKFW